MYTEKCVVSSITWLHLGWQFELTILWLGSRYVGMADALIIPMDCLLISAK